MRIVNPVKFKDNPNKTIKQAVEETLQKHKKELIENMCGLGVQRWKIKNNPEKWTEDKLIAKLEPENVIILDYSAAEAD